MARKSIDVLGARENNLKNIDVSIPRGSLCVITGLSGSGKSSLAFDTIFAEGQRRYIETFGTYARNFLDNASRPDVDKIEGLSPVISIDQKTINRNPRSTVGTLTEIYDYLRLLYARASTAYSYLTGKPMQKYTTERVVDLILKEYAEQKIYVLSPIVRGRKGHYRELFEQQRKRGFLYVRVDGELRELQPGMKTDRYKTHDIEVVIDKLRVERGEGDDNERERLLQTLGTAFKVGEGLCLVLSETGEVRYYSRHLMDPETGLAYKDPAPNDFSFNTSAGACRRCKGLGKVTVLDRSQVFVDEKRSIAEGAIVPLGKQRRTLVFAEIKELLRPYGCDLETPIGEIPAEAIDEIVSGSERELHISGDQGYGGDDMFVRFEGLAKYIRQMADSQMSAAARKWAEQFENTVECPECHGTRLRKEAMYFKIGDENICQVADMPAWELRKWVGGLKGVLSDRQWQIAEELVGQMGQRLGLLCDLGLGYLSMSRSITTLSGGESQRIRLASQIGSKLRNALYILDEPSIGLHNRDNRKLIDSLKELRDLGNTVIVVEHDRNMMLAADWVVDLGPGAGRLGGEVVFSGTPEDLLKSETLTGRYLSGKLGNERLSIGAEQGELIGGRSLRLYGLRGNNLKNIDVEIPLGKLVCVTGVSGSGKSTLLLDTLLPILSKRFYGSLREPLSYDRIEGVELLNKVVNVDQGPLGRTPRSNPATYTGVFTDIRNLFASTTEAAIRGYTAGRFSFNTGSGRCETCKGNGYKTIEMNFLPSVYVPCEECGGKRFNRETLEVKFKGKNIADVLDMTISQATEFFANVPNILHKIKALGDVGLGYIKLGQSSMTLSGGESQRVKLAAELGKKDTGRTLYILDEPTTGLHFDDIRRLMEVLQRLVAKGNSVVVIEHNIDVLRLADWIIDLGPDGGPQGGEIVATGTPWQVALGGVGFTAQFLREEFELSRQEIREGAR